MTRKRKQVKVVAQILQVVNSCCERHIMHVPCPFEENGSKAILLRSSHSASETDGHKVCKANKIQKSVSVRLSWLMDLIDLIGVSDLKEQQQTTVARIGLVVPGGSLPIIVTWFARFEVIYPWFGYIYIYVVLQRSSYMMCM